MFTMSGLLGTPSSPACSSPLLVWSGPVLARRLADFLGFVARLGPEECMEVADFVIGESGRLGRSLDMRLLINAFADRRQADDHDAGCTWQDLVASTLKGWPSVAGDIEPAGIRKITKARELEISREICGLDTDERLQAWTERTGKSKAALYRRLAELGRIDAQGRED